MQRTAGLSEEKSSAFIPLPKGGVRSRNKGGCKRLLAFVRVCPRLLAFARGCLRLLALSPLRLLAFVNVCPQLFAFARICLRPPLLRPPLRDLQKGPFGRAPHETPSSIVIATSPKVQPCILSCTV